MANRRTYFTNAFETTLSSSLGAGATTINVVDTTGSPALPFYLVLEPGNDSKREVVLVDSSKSATTFVLSGSANRGLDGTSDVTHDSGAPVKVVPVAAGLTDLHDRVDAKADTSHTHAAATVAAADVTYAGSTNLVAANVEAALDELDTEKSGTTHTHTVAAADVTYAGSADLAAANVEAALDELDTEKANARAGAKNMWVQSAAPTAVATGDIWVDTSA